MADSTDRLENWFLYEVMKKGEIGGDVADKDPENNRKRWEDVRFGVRRGDVNNRDLYDPSEYGEYAAPMEKLTQEELILKAIIANGGNVTLAMGSLAEVLCRAHNRKFARAAGLKGDGKDYYRFMGAYVGLQQSRVVFGLGYLGSRGNIGATTAVYTGKNVFDLGSAAEDKILAEKNTKITEFEIGFHVGWAWDAGQKHDRLRPLFEQMASSPVQRKRRGFSRYDDDDPELEQIHERVLSRYGEDAGVSLDISTKYRLERALGREIGEVRLHTGPVATALARETEAEALTSGRDVYMPAGTLDTSSPEGLGLLAHEVTHVVQQGPASIKASPRSLGGGSTGEVLERVAHAIERRVVASERATSYPVIEPIVREAPAAPAAPAPAPAAAPAAAPASQEAPAVSRSVSAAHVDELADVDDLLLEDPVVRAMAEYAVPPQVSSEEFLEICKERIMELMREEMMMDAERQGTLSWDESLPQS